MLTQSQIDSNIEYLQTDCTGCITDGYHTFDELYHHRTVLFASLVNVLKNKFQVYKSKKHHDGTMYEGMFIAGILTDYGQVSYHVEDQYWDYFQCDEINRAPLYDGSTPSEELERMVMQFCN